MLIMSLKRMLVIFLLNGCLWSMSLSRSSESSGSRSSESGSSSISGRPQKAKFQKGKGKCMAGDPCPTGYECRTEQITVTSSSPECHEPDIRSEVFARTEERRNTPITALNASDFYTNDSVFLFRTLPFIRFTDLSIGTTVVFFERLFLVENSEFRNTWTLEDLVYFNDDLVLSLHSIQPNSPNSVLQTALELNLWRREEGVLKIAVQTLNFDFNLSNSGVVSVNF
ncbi:uncharacterized protein LOC135481089 [Liolophura sinensis]|uniref:uncharacterized protein LOC135481089 n=1 Tax=Liolophura sinensis TaxID=3198878 RepID=UPI00315873E8